jgi:hypothetical protein
MSEHAKLEPSWYWPAEQPAQPMLSVEAPVYVEGWPWPAGHFATFVQSPCPVTSLYLPCAQFWQPRPDPAVDDLPAPHALQPVAVAVPAGEDFPASQLVQAPAFSAECCPMAQFWQPRFEPTRENLPAVHALQPVAVAVPAGAVSPAGHFWHSPTFPAECLPMAQFVQLVAEASENLPAPQSVHAASLVPAALPVASVDAILPLVPAVPAPHTVPLHASEPTSSAYWPAAHAMQEFALRAAVAANLPLSQTAHLWHSFAALVKYSPLPQVLVSHEFCPVAV